MRKYDAKYAETPEIQSLHNEQGWAEYDDKAFYTYGGGKCTHSPLPSQGDTSTAPSTKQTNTKNNQAYPMEKANSNMEGD